MKYINSKTGAVIESNSILKGVWKEYDPSNSLIDSKKEEMLSTNLDKEDKDETPTKINTKINNNSDEFEKVTIADIKKELDAFGIEHDSKMKKKELWDLMFEGK